jgi:membrane peptidoglycan carboxypeptidase
MHFFYRHKFLSVTLFLISLLLALIVYIALQAYLETPAVIKRINSSGKMTLKLRDVPEDFQTSLLVVEDPNFYNHHGIDLSTDGAGWTTITQGLVKVYFFENFTKGVFNKLRQSIIAVVFDNGVDKQTQLEIFINSVYLGTQNGREVIGFQDGARTYFEKDFSQLNKDEFLQLVAIIVAPNDYELKNHAADNQKRVNRIKRLLSGACKPYGFNDVFYQNCGD